MNKSKFLKKSLAALLAILMVAAMIPLSAAAAKVYPGNETIDVTEGTLARETEGDDSSWIVTIPYNGADSTTITVTSKDAKRFFEVQEDETLKEFEGASSAVVTVAPTQSATIVLRPADAEDETQDITYKFRVEKDATSNNTAIKTATFTYGAGADDKVTGEVNDAAKTITFTVPWGEVPSGLLGDANSPSGPNNTNKNVAVTLVNHPLNSNGSAVTLPATQPTVAADGTCSITVTAQDNGTDIYNVKFVEEEALTGLTIGGVDAVKGTDGKWTATLERTTLTTAASGLLIEVAAGKTVANIAMKKGASVTGGTDNLTNDKFDFSSDFASADSQDYKLTIKDEDNHWAKPVDLTVKVFKSSDTTLKSFTANVNNYIETAEISGKQVNLTVNKTATATQVADGRFNFAFDKPMSEVKLNGTAVVLSDDGKSVAASGDTDFGDGEAATLKNAGLVLGTGTNILDVTAEDDTTTDRYWINVVNAGTTTDTPVVTDATMTFGTEKYVGKVTNTTTTPKTIEFTVPAAVNKTKLNAALVAQAGGSAVGSGEPTATFEWKLSSHTYVDSTSQLLTSDYDDLFTSGTETVGGDPLTADNASLLASDTMYKRTGETTTNADTGKVTTAGTFAKTTPTNTILVKSDGKPAGETWTVIFKQDSAKEGHALGSTMTIKVADKEADVTEANTFKATVSNGATKGVTITDAIPYAMHSTAVANPGADKDKTVTIEFAVSDRAKLFLVKDTDAAAGTDNNVVEIGAASASGFKADGTRNGAYSVKISELAAWDSVMVVSEKGYKDVPSANAKKKSAYNSADYTEYPITKTLTPASAAKDIISLTADEGLVSSVVDAAAGTVTLTVPTTYVEKDKETKFNLVAEVSEFAKITTPSFTDGVLKNVVVKGDAENGYKLYIGSATTATTSFTVTAENTTTKLFNLTVQAADLDNDNSLSGITVKGEAATEGEDNAWTVELPYGTDLAELTTDDVVATVAEKADYTVAAGEEEGTFTITVKAENGQTADYTLTVTVADKPAAPEFDDVPTWAQDAVGKAAEMAWMVGTGNNKFSPSGEIRRGDFALTIARILEEDWANVSADYAKDVFTDVKEGDWYYEAVAYAVEKGIMNGRGNGFDPRTGITREEAAKVMCLAKGLDPVEGETTFGDNASIAGWAKPYVKACQDAGIFNGTNGNFNPKGKLSRAETAQVLVNAFYESEPAE